MFVNNGLEIGLIILRYFSFIWVVVFVLIPASSHQQRGPASQTRPGAQWHPASQHCATSETRPISPGWSPGTQGGSSTAANWQAPSSTAQIPPDPTETQPTQETSAPQPNTISTGKTLFDSFVNWNWILNCKLKVILNNVKARTDLRNVEQHTGRETEI